MTKMDPKQFQQSLINAGYALPKFGADGHWGTETANAAAAWFKDGFDIDVYEANTPLPPPAPTKPIVPASWMPACSMKRIIAHWTAGGPKASENDLSHYHILIERDGRLVRGTHPITANVSTSDGDYAAHTLDLNTGSIGVSVCAMADAEESPFDPGPYPMLESQWSTMANVVADLCQRYGIPLGKTTVLNHGMVQKTLGVTQNGKWDACKLPWKPSLTIAQADEAFREEVRKYLP